ncbi:hypothetical protein GTA08_BOTSDO03035 [Neofusicoccum parvum]|nr:hypothetical protein GTA08_BOTSDO03035 [Neofusicoccum parvum]
MAGSYCHGIPEGFFEDVQIVMKTGTSELYDRLATHLVSNSQCIPDLLIFSDAALQLGPYHIYDALSDLPKAYTENVPEFSLWQELQDALAQGHPLSSVKTDFRRAWTLDKYKFIPMIDKTFALVPNKKWYFFVEADTYIFWGNFAQWIGRLDPDRHLYLGNPMLHGDILFAYGGAGYLLSVTAMRKLLVDNRPSGEDKPGSTQFGVDLQHLCCGDTGLALALREVGVEVTSYWPMLNGHSWIDVPYGPGQWCHPLVTLHHMKPEDLTRMMAIERSRGEPAAPFLLEDLFNSTVGQELPTERRDWNIKDDEILTRWNEYDDQERFSSETWRDDVQQNSYSSKESCRKACEERADCVQWSYRGYKCGMGRVFRLGKPAPPDGSKQFFTGWIPSRVNDLRKDTPCRAPKWIEHE